MRVHTLSSPSTFRGYILAVKQFAEFFGESPERLGTEEVRSFQLHLLQVRKLKPHTVKTRIAALRFLYKKTLRRRDLDIDDLPFPKVPKRLPVVLSHEEVTRLIEAAPSRCARRDRRHRTLERKQEHGLHCPNWMML